MGAQITNLKKQQQYLLREKQKLQANLRNAQRKKQRLSKRTRMLSDTDLIDIMRMREAHSCKENKVVEEKPAEPIARHGAAAVPGEQLAAGDPSRSSAASEGNAEQLDNRDF